MLRSWFRAAASGVRTDTHRSGKARVALTCAATAALLAAAQIAPARADTGATTTSGGATYTETYRPQFHFC
jgi:hypothetical protein